MLRTRPAITAAEGVRSTATYTDVPKFGFRDARLTVVFIASGDRRWGRFWGSITCFIFPPGGRAMEGRLSYVLRPRSHDLIFTSFVATTGGMPFHLRDHGERSGGTSVSTRVMHAGGSLGTTHARNGANSMRGPGFEPGNPCGKGS